MSYPLSFPGGIQPGAAKSVWRYVKKAGVSESEFTRQAQVFAWPGDGWEVEISFPPMKREDAAKIIATLVSLDGMVGTFYWGPDGRERNPQSTAAGSLAGFAAVNGANQSGVLVNIDNWTGVMKAGDFLSISHESNTKRLYMNLTDVTGPTSLDIRPALRSPAPVDNATVELINPKGTFRLASNSQEWSIDEAQIYGISFKAIEALEIGIT